VRLTVARDLVACLGIPTVALIDKAAAAGGRIVFPHGRQLAVIVVIDAPTLGS
jgi:hypothetical protein